MCVKLSYTFHFSYEHTCLQLFWNTAPSQSPALLNRQVKLLLSPFLLLRLFLLYRSEWRTQEVEVLASQDSNGQVGKRHWEDSRMAFRLVYTSYTWPPMPAGSTVLGWRWQVGWPEHTQFPGRRLDAHTTLPAPDQPAQPRKPSKTQRHGPCQFWGWHHKEWGSMGSELCGWKSGETPRKFSRGRGKNLRW